MESKGAHSPLHKRIREYTRTGRSGGTDDFVSQLEDQTERTLRKGKPGPKSRLN